MRTTQSQRILKRDQKYKPRDCKQKQKHGEMQLLTINNGH